MKVADFLHRVEEEIPKNLALDWDNVGLLVGDENARVSKVYLALDATDEVIDHAIEAGADLLLTHHPLIFSGMKQVVRQDFVGRRVMKMIEHGMSYGALHTNFDVQVMGEIAGRQLGLSHMDVLDVTVEDKEVKKGIGCVADAISPISLYDLANKCKSRFDISSVKVFGDGQTQLNRIAISPGAGKGEVEVALNAGAQVLITGDIDHHTGIDAVARGLNIIDAGHYGIEHIFTAYMEAWIKKNFADLQVFTEPAGEPFWVI